MPIIDNLKLENDTILNADVCIVGAGMSGQIIASKIKNKKIIIIDSGDVNYNSTIQQLNDLDNRGLKLRTNHVNRVRQLGGSANLWANQLMLLEENEIIKPHFTIYLRNKGQGEVINQNSVDNACSASTIGDSQLNYLNVNVNLGDMQSQLTCKPNQIKLKDDAEIIRCTLDEGVDKSIQPYTTVLNIKLDYGYIETISKSVQIRENR